MKKWLNITLWIIAIIIFLGIIIGYVVTSTRNMSTCNAYAPGYVCIEDTCKLTGNSGCNPEPPGYPTIAECELECGK